MSELEFIDAYRGSVNRWDCDENDHLNVRFYARMVWESLSSALPRLGVSGTWRITYQHMRFIAEARMATPIAGRCALVACENDTVTALVELREAAAGDVLAAFVCGLEVSGGHLPNLADLPLPAHAGPRGLLEADSPLIGRLSGDLAAMGFVNVGRGTVRPDECYDGALPAWAAMGRMSDAMPHLWAHLHSVEDRKARAEGFLGGAVVEYRLCHHEVLKAGDSFEIWSGVRALANKTQQFEHLLYNTRTNRCVASAQAVAVVLDLNSRKAVPLPEARKKRMLELLIRAE